MFSCTENQFSGKTSFYAIGPCAYPLPRPPTSWPSYFSSPAWLPESSRQALHNIPFQDYWFDPHTTYSSFINKACVTQNENGRATSSQPSSNYISGSAVCYKHEEVAIKSSVPLHFRMTKIPFLKSFSRAVCLSMWVNPWIDDETTEDDFVGFHAT